MIQVLCYTGKGFDTCWRPASVATRQVWSGVNVSNQTSAPYTPIRFIR